MDLTRESILTIRPPSTADAYELFIIGKSKGKIIGSVKVSLTYTKDESEKQTTLVYSSLVNRQPQLEGLIEKIKVNATRFEANDTLKDSSIYVYDSPVATDEEGDEISFKFLGIKGKEFMKI